MNIEDKILRQCSNACLLSDANFIFYGLIIFCALNVENLHCELGKNPKQCTNFNL